MRTTLITGGNQMKVCTKVLSLPTVFGALSILSFLSLTLHSQAFAASESIPWSFGSGTDGDLPAARLIMDSHGNLFGTTRTGGANDNLTSNLGGTVFELTPPATAGGSWTESVLWNFGAGTDGNQPKADLIMDTNGNLYGTTSRGGVFASPSDLGGTVFELTPPVVAGGSWTESLLWNFGNGTDGSQPQAGLIMDKTGNLYGTTFSGGSDSMGTVFELRSAGGGFTESVLFSFDGTDGEFPTADLIMDAGGNLYGTTQNGGSFSEGTVFELTPHAGGTWTESILWNFDPGSTGTKDGIEPVAGVIMDAGGKLFGTTALGGANFKDGASIDDGGTAFMLTPPATVGGSWTESILWNFGKGKDGVDLGGGLIADKAGNLYGTTRHGGTSGLWRNGLQPDTSAHHSGKMDRNNRLELRQRRGRQ